MQDPTKKHHTDKDMITLRLKVHRINAAKVKEFAREIEEGKERTHPVNEVFPDLIHEGQVIALHGLSNS